MRFFSTLILIGIQGMAHAQLPPYVAEDLNADDGGYYFLTTLRFNGGGNANSEAVMLDGGGDVAFHQRMPNVSNFRVWPDGRMSYAARGKHLLLDGSFTLIDSVSCANGVTNDLHELRILANGHYLLLGAENVIMDLSGYSYFQNGTAPGSASATVKSVVIQELDADKNLVWEWHAIDHFDFLDVDTLRLMNPNMVDWTHSNALELDAEGNVLLSSRHFNEITKIDRVTGDVIWRMGGARNEFNFINDPGFLAQHDIRRLPNGHITLFDNSNAGAHPGRGVEYELDEGTMTVTPIWSRAYDPGAYSKAMGSVQRLSNGNTLIGWGALTPDNATFTTYGPDGTRISELYFPDTIVTYRAYYFDSLPFTLQRPTISCAVVSDGYELTATPATSYLWSTGETSRTIVVGLDDTVHVEVPVGSGGFLRSMSFVAPVDCFPTGLANGPQATDVVIYPNPAGSVVHVRMNRGGVPQQVQLIDAVGRVLWTSISAGNELHISIPTLPGGLYFVRVDGRVHRFVKE